MSASLLVWLVMVLKRDRIVPVKCETLMGEKWLHLKQLQKDPDKIQLMDATKIIKKSHPAMYPFAAHQVQVIQPGSRLSTTC